MKRILLILLLGACGAVAAHLAWYQWRTPAISEREGGLAWLRSQLMLSAEQYARLQALHEQSDSRLRALANDVRRMEQELAAFERQREASGEIDFLAFARFVQQRRNLENECAESTRHLVAATAEIMTAEQRERYLHLVEPALRAEDRSAVN